MTSKKIDELDYYKSKCESLEKGLLKLRYKHSNLHDMCCDLECENNNLKKDVDFLEEQNKKLKIENELLSDELEQCKAVIAKKWSEYLKKKELSE